jgi:signal transduction histidine kinase
MKIKSKISLGLAFLFTVILLLGACGIYYMHKLSNDASMILVDNYESLEYCKNMLRAMDEFEVDPTALTTFESNLKGQQSNITEGGETEATTRLKNHFLQLKNENTQEIKQLIRNDLLDIQEINMAAIERKNEAAENTAAKAILYLSIIGTISFLVAFSFIVNFPGYIANPIRDLTTSIKEIADKKYHSRLHFKSNDEFGEVAEAFNRMAQKLEEYDNSNMAELLFEKKRIDAIINNMKDPVIGLDEKKQILFINIAGLNIIGMNEKDLIGKYAPDVAATNDLMRALIKEIMSGEEQPEPVTLKIFADNKESFFTKDIYNVTIVPTGEINPKTIGHVIRLKNVTAFKELDLAKTNFLATISHELKTPLSSIKMGTQLLNDNRVGELNAEQKQIIQSINEQANRLTNITGELLDMTQIETGNIHLEKKKVNAGAIIQYAIDATEILAEQKNIKIETSVQENLPEFSADEDKTDWVLINLITNAIRYSDENSRILISAELAANAVKFSVRDFGKGIRVEDQSKIFDKYFKAGNNHNNEGTGLGLAISKEFITAQGGTIYFESEPLKGSTFSFELNI